MSEIVQLAEALERTREARIMAEAREVYARRTREHDKLYRVAEAPRLGEGYKALLRKVIRESLKGLDMKQVTAVWTLAANYHSKADKRKGA